jgi:hypothetical protein
MNELTLVSKNGIPRIVEMLKRCAIHCARSGREVDPAIYMRIAELNMETTGLLKIKDEKGGMQFIRVTGSN